MRLPATVLGLALVAGSTGLAIAADRNAPIIPAQASGMTDAQVRQSLENQGYTNVRVTEHGKSHVDVSAMKDGKPVKLAVNPQTGSASPDNDKDD